MATHSSILAWKIPWTEESGGLHGCQESDTIEQLTGFPAGSGVKESVCNSGDMEDMGSIPGLGRSPGEVDGNPLQ